LVNVGAVYVSTLLGDVGVLVQVPIVPVPPCILSPLLQFFTVCCAGFGTAVVGATVYTYEQVQTEVVVSVPVTVEVNVWTPPASTTALPGDTVSMTVFGLELLQPFCHSSAAASTSSAAVLVVRNFMNDISLIDSTQAMTRAHFLKAFLPGWMA